MIIADYQTIARICSIADADLFRARRLPDGAQALLKVHDPVRAGTGAAALQREYRLLQSLDIANAIKPLALIDEHDHLAAVYEDFDGESLKAVLSGNARLDLPACLHIAIRIAHALSSIHAAQLVHRGIRPANILVDRERRAVRLADFRLAAGPGQDSSPHGEQALASDWVYVSPEQTGRMNRPVDYRTDFYLLGMTLYRMLTGRLPFEAADVLEWVHCHIARNPAPPHEIEASVPEAVSSIVMKLLAKLPEDRYQSAHGLQADLERCLAQWQAEERIEPFPLGAHDAPDHFQIPHRLYGREQETAALQAAFEHMVATGDAGLVAISGYSGIGKSSLVHELFKPIARERGYFIAGKFDLVMRDIPYATLTQAFHDLVQLLLAESEARIAAWREQILEAVGANGQLIIDVLPQVELIIGRQPPVTPLPPVEAQNRFRLVFLRFLAVFARREHPLTLFLDDMQWADAASLQFVEHLLNSPDIRYLLLIAAWRDNEVSASHPLSITLATVRRNGAAMVDIRLAPLPAEQLNRLTSDTLHAPPESCMPLTSLVFERTEGNPFFFTQFLDALHKEGLLRHDPLKRNWRWDLDRIKARDFADNVADLMAGKLRRLPTPVQEALQLAACLGNSFELRHLAMAGGLDRQDTAERLLQAAQEGLILLAGGNGKFLHDRIQQAAYGLIPETRRAEVHLRIGRTLAAAMDEAETSRHLFDLAHQFNQGAALLADPREKTAAAELNLRAGRKAKAAAAYASACVYLAAGMALLGDEGWDGRHELMFNLCLERAECEFLSGRLDTAGQLIATLLEKAASKAELAAAYRHKVALHVMKSEIPQALDSALACLRLFGIDLPAHPSREQVQEEYEQIWRNLGERPIESIAGQPPASDPESKVAMDMLTDLVPPAIYTDFNLFLLVTCRLVNLGLRHGASDASAYGYALFGVMLGPSFHRYSDGYRFGELGRELCHTHGFAARKAVVYSCAGFNAVWTQPVATAAGLMRDAFRAGVETGSLLDACNSWVGLLNVLLMQGAPLDAVWRESETGMDFVRAAKYQDDVNVLTSIQRFIAAMQGRTADISTFNDAGTDTGAFDEAAFDARLAEDKTAAPIARHRLLQMQTRLLAGDHAQALAAMRETEATLWSLSNLPVLVPDYHYYAALTMAALYEDQPAQEQAAWRERLAAHREQLREWAECNPATFGDKHALVSAEIARLEGRDADAMRLYEQAIQSARASSFAQYEGMAHEAALRFYLSRGSATAARAHLAGARECFARWSADAKVRQLDERYPQLRAQAATAAPAMASVAQLDALSVAKASRAISGRIVLEELIDTLMRIVLENAGAQAGILMLARGEELLPAAHAEVAQQEVEVRMLLGQGSPLPVLPSAIFNYVRRSQSRVLLPDAAEAHPFAADPRLVRRKPKSVLCIPIVRQDALVGLLYLENNLISHAFTPERLTVLELLASQAAISLENALLYTELQQENSERKRVEAALREREARIRRLVESNIIGVFFWNTRGDIIDANDAFLRLIGRGREELLSGKLYWKDFNAPEYEESDRLQWEEVSRTGAISSYEKEFVRKDGTRIPVLVGGALLEGSRDNGVGFVLDLSERKQAEVERAARLAADTANKAKSDFLANMSHELRTPLNGILGYAQILQRDRTMDARQQTALNVIRQSGEHLLTLINDILDLAKIEACKMELDPGNIPLAEFLCVIAEMIGVKASQKNIEFSLDMAPDLPSAIVADQKRLRQVLLNLLSNAIKFTDSGRVTLRARPTSPGRLLLEVEDTGTGIEQDQLEKIFQPFEQAGEMQRRVGGTGLGLAISRQFVRLMGGEIRVESRIGQGSRFWFELDAATTQAGQSPAPAAPVVTGYKGPRKTILAVDDIDENRFVLIDMLQPLGFRVFEAANGREALEKAQALRPDLILMDTVMPEMDGLEALRRLRRMPGLDKTAVIAISANASGGDAQSSLAAGANAFLPKPINLDRLLKLAGELLGLTWIETSPDLPPPGPEEDDMQAVPPLEEMETLHYLAKLGNMQDILQRADHLAGLDERYRPFADKLASLAREYRSKSILSLVEQYLERSRTSS